MRQLRIVLVWLTKQASRKKKKNTQIMHQEVFELHVQYCCRWWWGASIHYQQSCCFCMWIDQWLCTAKTVIRTWRVACLTLSLVPLSTHLHHYSSLFRNNFLFFISANLERIPGQRRITLSCISNLINLKPLEGNTLQMNNYSISFMSCQCQHDATVQNLWVATWNSIQIEV